MSRYTKIKSNFWIRFIAFFLMIFAAAALVTNAVGILYAASSGYYVDNGESERDMIRQSAAYKYSRAAVYDYYSQQNIGHFVSAYNSNYYLNLDNVDYSISNPVSGEILFSDIVGGKTYALTYTDTVETEIYVNDDSGTYYDELTVTCCIPNDAPFPDWFTNKMNISIFLSNWKYVLIVTAALLLIANIALFIFLMQSAGFSSDGKATPGFLGKLPIEVFSFLIVILAVSAYFIAIWLYELSLYNNAIPAIIFFSVICFTLSVWLFMSICARFRSGTFFRTCLTWLIIRAIGRFWRWVFRIYHKAGFLWRSAILLCAFWFWFIIFLVVAVNETVFPLLLMAVLMSVVFSIACANLAKLKRAVDRLAAGDYTAKVSTVGMFFDFRRAAKNINRAGDGMSQAVDERMKSERMKAELITNVSHDLKTPLTSIVNCVDLLKNSGETLSEQGTEYLEILDRQSKRLKKLTEDVLVASKASTGNLSIELAPVDMEMLLSQAIGEYSDKLNDRNLKTMIAVSEGSHIVLADGKLLWRVFDNLFSNIVKYALPGTRVYLDIGQINGTVIANFRNVSEFELPSVPSELTERFVRGDASRHTEGSGLGLSIAENLCTLMGGKLVISTEADLFKATVSLPACVPLPPASEQNPPIS